MMKKDPDPDKRITNSDEQEVAVNHSTREEGGYDEPSSARENDNAGSAKDKSNASHADDKPSPDKKGPASGRKIN